MVSELTIDYPECSGNPKSCPENEGYGCCKPVYKGRDYTLCLTKKAKTFLKKSPTSCDEAFAEWCEKEEIDTNTPKGHLLQKGAYLGWCAAWQRRSEYSADDNKG